MPLFHSLNPVRKINMIYSLILVYRRVIFVGIALYLPNYNWIQAMVLIFSSLIFLMHAGHNQPFNDKLRNFTEISQEVIVLLILYLFMA